MLLLVKPKYILKLYNFDINKQQNKYKRNGLRLTKYFHNFGTKTFDFCINLNLKCETKVLQNRLLGECVTRDTETRLCKEARIITVCSKLGPYYMIPEWLSFWNEFIPSPKTCMCPFTWCGMKCCSGSSHSRMSSSRFSIRMRFSFRNEISFLYHVNPDRTSFRDENYKPWSLARATHA